jgi:hypothetical protein
MGGGQLARIVSHPAGGRSTLKLIGIDSERSALGGIRRHGGKNEENGEDA